MVDGGLAQWIIELMFDRERAIAVLNADRCACPGCKGSLTDHDLSPRGWRHCQSCRCAWKVAAIDGQTYATAIHSPDHALPTKDANTHQP